MHLLKKKKNNNNNIRKFCNLYEIAARLFCILLVIYATHVLFFEFLRFGGITASLNLVNHRRVNG
jgi:hypothetical protein